MRLKPAILITACAGFLLSTGTGAGQNSSGTNNTTVTVEGCPVPGVEGGCLVIKAKDGKLWEIGSSNPRPDVGAHVIRLTGQVSTQPSTCMQGTKLDHIQWRYTDQTCPRPDPR